MRFGSPLAAGYGNPENALEFCYIDPARLATYGEVLVRFKNRTAGIDSLPGGPLGNAFYETYLNNVLQDNRFCADGVDQAVKCVRPANQSQLSICVLRVGHFGDKGYNIARVARYSELNNSQLTTIVWKWVAKILGPDQDQGWTASWSGTGFVRENTTGVAGEPYYSYLTFDIFSDGTNANATVNVYNQAVLVASGTGAVGAPITLTAQQIVPATANAPAVMGPALTVTVNTPGNNSVNLGAKLFVRWPANMQILRDTVNPPLALVATIPYNQQTSYRWVETANLAGGTYYYELRELSDGVVAGTPTAAQTVLIKQPPVAPTALVFVSGTAAAGMVIQFLNSTTAGATYNIYVGLEDVKQINLLVPDVTAVAGAPSAAHNVNIPLGVFTGWTAGKRCYILVRAVSGGVEEPNAHFLILNLSSPNGAPQSLQPNAAALIVGQVALNGRQIQVRGTYPTVDEKGAAVSLQLFDRGPNGSYNLAAPLQAVALAVTSTNIKSASFNYTYNSNIGARWFACCAITADGVQGPLSAEIGPFDLTLADLLPAVTDFRLDVARG